MASKKKRVRVWSSEDRAAHRVFEKSRREAFNDGMINLARQLPSLVGTRRLNKHLIVEHSLARHKAQKQLAHAAVHEFRELLAERDELIAEVNRWRSASGAAIPPRQARQIGQPLRALLDTEKETFGVFPNGFGDNGSPEDSVEHDRDETTPEVAGYVSCTINNVPGEECSGQNPTSISSTAPDLHLGSIPDPPAQSLTACSNTNVFNYGESFDLDLQRLGLPHGLSLASDTPIEGLDIESSIHQGGFDVIGGAGPRAPSFENFPLIGFDNATNRLSHYISDLPLENHTHDF